MKWRYVLVFSTMCFFLGGFLMAFVAIWINDPFKGAEAILYLALGWGVKCMADNELRKELERNSNAHDAIRNEENIVAEHVAKD